MRRKFNSTQRNYIIAGLCMILVIMGVGYAAFTSQLKISGTSKIVSNFLVKITNIEVSNVVGSAADKSEVTTHTDTTATFGTTLQSPGDSITYDITIENQGTIDAVLKTITKTDTNNSAILFETNGVFEGDELKSHETAKMQVTVTYNPEVTSQPSDLNSNLKVELGYEQAPEGYVPPARPITPDDLKALAVTEGDGLYADEYETGKYDYRGSNPNNYITFNNETWRIISIDTDGKVKIIYADGAYGTGSGGNGWDGTGSNNWDRPSNIKSYLNGSYLATITINKDKIVPSIWSIGGVIPENNDLGEQINDENEEKSRIVSVGLITVSEYLRANPNKEQCGSIQLNNTNNNICLNTNWINTIIYSGDKYQYMWTISKSSQNNTGVYNITNSNTNSRSGQIDVNNYIDDVDGRTHTYPSLYLSSNIILLGTGTSSDPYVITN